MEIEITELYQLYLSPDILKDDELNPADRLLIAIISAFDKGADGCYLSNTELGRLAGCSPGSVSKSVNKMYDIGHIIVNQPSAKFGGRRFIRKVAPHVKRKTA